VEYSKLVQRRRIFNVGGVVALHKPPAWTRSVGRSVGHMKIEKQGLTLVHFSAQLEPCLSQETPSTP
jgi:hypothetical protein